MTTVREARIRAAKRAITKQIGLGYLVYPVKGKQLAAAHVECAAEAVVDALFPDHLLDDVIVYE